METAANYIKQNNQPEFLHLRYNIKNSQGVIMSEAPLFPSPPNRRLIFGNFLSCNGVFLRKDIAAQNPFNEDRELSAMEDWELWLRLSSQYPLHYVNTITSSIINHNERSVVLTKKEALVLRSEAMIKHVTGNKRVVEYYQDDISKFISSCYSYVALHLSLTRKNKKDALKYLALSFFKSPAIVFQKRFFAILKHLV